MKCAEEVVKRLGTQLTAFEIIAEGNSKISSVIFHQFISSLENILSAQSEERDPSKNDKQSEKDFQKKKIHLSIGNDDHPTINDTNPGKKDDSEDRDRDQNQQSEVQRFNDLNFYKLVRRVRRQLEAFKVFADPLQTQSLSTASESASTLSSTAVVSHELCTHFIQNVRSILEPQPKSKSQNTDPDCTSNRSFVPSRNESVKLNVSLGLPLDSLLLVKDSLPNDPSVICSIPLSKIPQCTAASADVANDSLDTTYTHVSKRRRLESSIEDVFVCPTSSSSQHPSNGKEITRGIQVMLHVPPDSPTTSDPESTFQNDLVLLELFKYLPSTDLIQFRLVSLKWNEHATTILLRRKAVEVKFCYSAKMKKFFASTSKRDGTTARESLMNLNNRIKNPYSKKFPCNSFYFKGGNMAVPEVQEFFRLQGGIIKRLKLELTSYIPAGSPGITSLTSGQYKGPDQGLHGQFTSITTFRMLLLHQLPFLEDLHLKKFPSEWKSNFAELFPEPAGSIALPRLKTIQVSRSDLWTYTKIMGDILRAAVNLQKIESLNFELKNVDVFLLGQKIHMIKSITYYGDQKCIPLYEKFANALPVIRQIQFDMEYFYKHQPTWLRVTNTINKIFESSKDSLEEIVIFNPIGFLPSLILPKLENLKNLVVEDQYDDVEEDRFRSVFPLDFNLAEKFPNLQVFTMNLRNLKSNEMWEDYFPNESNSHPVPSVKRVEIGYQLNSSWIGKLTKLFPLVTRLEMQRIYNFPEIAKELWNFPKLKKAKFEIEVGAASGGGAVHSNSNPGATNCYPGLDAAFTGFAESTVVSLKELSRTVDLVEVENLRESPSILQLKDLKLLWIRFSDMSPFDKNSYPAFLSHVTPIFGFKLLDGLRVKVSACSKEARNLPKLIAALESVSPFVEIVNDNPNL